MDMDPLTDSVSILLMIKITSRNAALEVLVTACSSGFNMLNISLAIL